MVNIVFLPAPAIAMDRGFIINLIIVVINTPIFVVFLPHHSCRVTAF